MVKIVDSRQNSLDRLRSLRAEKPLTQMGQIRWAWPEIKAALALGHSLTTIHQRLHEVGIQIPYKRLSLYLGRLRREEGTEPASPVVAPSDIVAPVETRKLIPCPAPPRAASDPDTITVSHPEAPVAHDPLANLRKYANTRPGFHWDEAPPDKNKLF
jgi:hypothetical protein